MQPTDNLRQISASKLLPFRSSSSALPGSGTSLDPARFAHDIGTLRRPEAASALPPMNEQDGLAHDARNLLTSLELVSGLLAEPGVLSEEHRHFAGDLQSLAGPLASLIEQMANAVRSQAERPIDLFRSSESGAGSGEGEGRGKDPVFAREPLRPALALQGRSKAGVMPGGLRESQAGQDAGAMVKSCERLLGSIAGPGVALNISYERGLGVPALNGEGVTRVLINLVKNASEAMPGGGRVAITVRKGLGAKPSAILRVEDTGNGIPAHAMGQVFQAGFSSKKAHHAWPATRHHGLGLTIVRDLVESAGGSVRVVSALKKGTTFEIKLPCRPA